MYWTVKISHVYREGNQLANWLAGLATRRRSSLEIWERPLEGCSRIFLGDLAGISFNFLGC